MKRFRPAGPFCTQGRTLRAACVGLFVGMSVVSSAGCGTAPRASTVQMAEKADVTFTQLAPDVWMHTSYRYLPRFGNVVSHGLIVVKGQTSVLVDSAWDDADTAKLVAFATDELKRPIDAAVFTHAHEDKMGGVGHLRAVGIETFATEETNALAPSHNLVPATHTFSVEGTVIPHAFGELVIFAPGPGHAPDNIVVYHRASGILFGGCLIRPPGAVDLGNTADADLGHWDLAVEAVAARFSDATVVVPSHGDPGGRELLSATVALVQAARAR